MNAIVQSPVEAVEQLLDVQASDAFAKPSEDDIPNVRDAIAICIFAKQDVRCGSDKHAAPITNQRRWPGQVVGEHRAFVETPVAIRVFEQPDASQMFIPALRVIPHLDHI